MKNFVNCQLSMVNGHWAIGAVVALAVVLLCGVSLAQEAPPSPDLPEVVAPHEPDPPQTDTPRADVQLQPGDYVPPVTQLDRQGPVIPWDPDRVGEFQLVDQNNRPVTRETLLGKPWVANFIFTRCSTHCPATSLRIRTMLEELAGVDVRFVTITVDPEHDTPEMMDEFASIWRDQPEKWMFLTGEPAEIWKLIREGFKVPAWENVGTDQMPGMEFAHSNHLIHVDANGKILGRYNSGIATEVETLKRVLRGRIETPKEHQPATRDQVEALARLQGNSLSSGGAGNVNLMSEGQRRRQAIEAQLPEWAHRLPTTNALLNSLSTILLVMGYVAAKTHRFRLHKQAMLMAFFVSIAFLGSYLLYHWTLTTHVRIDGKIVRGMPYTGPEQYRWIYAVILWTHIPLAVTVPFLAIITIRNGLRAYPATADADAFRSMMQERYDHKCWAVRTFPIWLYVSITGVAVYWMLYRL